jgi:tetratricopeptide (TPR) repeat protein
VLLSSLLGCSGNEELQQQFQIEKTYFRAQKIAEAILINPRIAPAKDFADAIALYRQVVKEAEAMPSAPTTVSLVKQSLMKMAQLEMMQEQLDAAIEIYREILKRFSSDDDVTIAARLALGLLHERSLEYRDAVEAYSGLLPSLSSRVEPETPDAFLIAIPIQFARLKSFALGSAQGKEAYGQASDIYTQIINTWPNSKAALLASNYLAAIWADQGRWEEVNTLLDKQIKSHADSSYLPEFLYLKALLLHSRLGQTASAMNLFQDIAAKYPQHEAEPRALLEIAKIYMEQKNYEKAGQLLKSIVEKNGKVPAVAAQAQEGIARCFEMEGRWDLAINEYRWLSQQYETSPPAFAAPIHIANYYSQRNDAKLAEKAFAEAIEFYKNLITKYPQTLVAALAQEQIANCFIAQKKWNDAVSAASNLPNVLDSNAGRISSYLLLGNIYESTGQRRLAAKIYQQFIEQFPQHPLVDALKEKVQRLMNS